MSVQASLLAAKPAQKTTERERRVSVRYQCSREASCSSLAPFERLSGRLRDISTRGIALVLSTKIRQGTELVIELKTRNPGICLTLLARVVHSTLENEGAWIIGGELLTTPTEEQIHALI
jgi:hypothetical protein